MTLKGPRTELWLRCATECEWETSEVLRWLIADESMAASDISKEMGLSLVHVIDILQELIDKRFITENLKVIGGRK